MTEMCHNAGNFKYIGVIWFVNLKLTYVSFKTLISMFFLTQCMFIVRNLGNREMHKLENNYCK